MVDQKEDRHQTLVVVDHQDKETEADGHLPRETHPEVGVATIQNKKAKKIAFKGT